MRNPVLVSRWWLVVVVRPAFGCLLGCAVRLSRAVRGRFGWGRLRAVLGALVVLLCVVLVAAPASAFVYWVNDSGGASSIGRANLDGTGVNQSFITGLSGAVGLAVDGQHVYWTQNVSTIARANLDGTDVNQNFITGVNPEFVAVDGMHIYWSDGENAMPIGRANLDGTDVNRDFITGTSDPQGVAVAGQHIYWTNASSGTIGRANLDGTGVNQSFITGADAPVGVAVDGQHVYWTNAGSGTIGRASLDGTGVNQSFIIGAGEALSLAVGAHHLYWGTAGEQTVGRANLDGTGVNQDFIKRTAAFVSGVAVDTLKVPTVTGVSPNVGSTAGGTSVTINGTSFTPGTTVSFGAIPATNVNVVSSTQLQATAPAQSAGTVHVTVTRGATSATSTKDLYAYGPPSIGSFTPSSGITGSAVKINGTGFVSGVKVSFGALAGRSVAILSGTQLRAVVPKGAVPATVSVSDAQGSATSTTQFTPTLSITGFSPTSGPVGTLITIDGVGFNASSTVKFQTIAASSVAFVSPSELQATVPAGPRGETIIKVTNATSPIGTVKSAANFRVNLGDQGAARSPLTPGWDIFSGPLTKGSVVWNVPDGQRRLNVTFILNGALPDHQYTVGAHFFQAGTDVDFGAGKHIGGGTITRDGVTADVDGWDFGFLLTDSEGDGSAHFNLVPNSGTYHVQFTVRIGGAPGCFVTDCRVVYRTGYPFSVNTEKIIIP
jgi:virginiamycin B lyase